MSHHVLDVLGFAGADGDQEGFAIVVVDQGAGVGQGGQAALQVTEAEPLVVDRTTDQLEVLLLEGLDRGRETKTMPVKIMPTYLSHSRIEKK